MSALSADQRVSMSLDDIVNKTKKNNERKRRNRENKGAAANGNKKSDNSSAKVAKSVGAGKAKRAANVDKRRGLNATGKATKAQVQGAILRAGQKKRPSSAGSNSTGLKISFKPKELKQTTDKLVAQQISAVLAKQPTKNNNNSKPSTPNTPKKRSVILTPTGSARGNPKKRNNNNNNNKSKKVVLK